MAVRSKNSISEELGLSKREDRDFFKNALLIVETFPESYIENEFNRIRSEIETLQLKKSPEDIMQNNKHIDAEIKRLKSKFKMFSYLIIQ